MDIKKNAIKWVTNFAHKNNYNVIAEWDTKDFPFARHLISIFNKYEIDCVIDVGANFGQYGDFLRNNVGYSGLILSFEPVPSIAQALREKASLDHNWEVYDSALGSASNTMEMNVTKAPSRNSLLPPRFDAVKEFWSSDAITEVITVNVDTLDQFLERRGIDCSKQGVYLKMDTQGFDLEVTKGASESLKNIRALQTEASVRPIYHNMPNYKETLSFMNSSGFQISGMFSVSNDNALRMVEFDCVLVNDRFATPLE